MKIVAISDSHHKHYYIRLPKADMLIHCGDFTYRGERIERLLVQEWLLRQSKTYKYVVFIMGNHDINMHKGCFDLPSNCYHLQDSGVEIEGINFYGSPYTVRFGAWGFGEPEDKLAVRFNHIPKSTDILLTHGPAYSILDRNVSGECCGSKSLYEKIKKLPNLKYHLFGHIHESAGQEKIEDITFINCSILDERYEINNKPVIIEV